VRRYKVGILGATGVVGQRLIQRLAGHPWFEIAVLAASERSAGRPYGEVTSWKVSEAAPPDVRERTVVECNARDLEPCDLVLSALDAPVAREVEPELARRGFAVISNSSAFRQAEDVPLLIPEINAVHLDLLRVQRSRTGSGFIVTNPNCSATGLAIAVAPLHRAFGLRRLVVTTLQAVSGAGAEGPRALDLLDNVSPYIAGEEEKLETELSKILGRVSGDAIERAGVVVSASCHRVPVVDGHLEAASLELATDVSPETAVRTLRAFDGDVAGLELPSFRGRPIVVRDEPDRPQPRLDRDTGGGMAVVVGRVRRCPVLGLKLELLAHNTIRGAAGGTLLNAELLAARELIPRRNGR
jgi:aspartate-semialdehyde dehydrogenase